MKELRITQTMRVFFAFDPERTAVLLIGGDKAGKTKRFYKKMIPVADRIYDRHLRELAEHEGGKEHQDAKDEKKAVQRAKQGSQKAPRRRP
jgi:hypothetical protein